jgi:hypothetical protein
MGRRLVGSNSNVASVSKNRDSSKKEGRSSYTQRLMMNVDLGTSIFKASEDLSDVLCQEDTYVPMTQEEWLAKVLVDKDTVCIEEWSQLAGLESSTHYIEVEEDCRGWIVAKEQEETDSCVVHYGRNKQYLSTHTFYERGHIANTVLLQECGFNIVLESWG